MRGQSTLQPVTMERVKPESDPSQGNVTVEQRDVVCEEHRGVVRMNLSGQSNAGEPKGANEFLLKVTEHIQSTLREKRQKYDRPEELHVSWPCMYICTYIHVSVGELFHSV